MPGNEISFDEFAAGQNRAANLPASQNDANEISFEDFQVSRDKQTAKRDAVTAERERDRTPLEVAKDFGLSLGVSGNSVVGMVVGAIAPDSKAAKYFQDSAKRLQSDMSAPSRLQMEEAKTRIAEAAKNGEVDALLEGLDAYTDSFPVMQQLVTENLLSSLGPAALGKVTQILVRSRNAWMGAKVAETTASTAGIAAAGGTGALVTGGDARQQSYDDIYKVLRDKGIPEKEARDRALTDSKAALATGILVNGVLAPTGVNKVLMGNNKGGNILSRAAAPAAVQMADEVADEVIPQAVGNLAASQKDIDPNRPLTQGLGDAAASTIVSMGPMSAGTGGLGAYNLHNEGRATPSAPQDPTKPPEAILKTTNTEELVTEVDNFNAHDTTSTEDYVAQARADAQAQNQSGGNPPTNPPGGSAPMDMPSESLEQQPDGSFMPVAQAPIVPPVNASTDAQPSALTAEEDRRSSVAVDKLMGAPIEQSQPTDLNEPPVNLLQKAKEARIDRLNTAILDDGVLEGNKLTVPGGRAIELYPHEVAYFENTMRMVQGLPSQPTKGQNVQDIPATQGNANGLTPETGGSVGVNQEQVATQVAPVDLVALARKGDKDAQDKLTAFGLNWDGDKTKYRIINGEELALVLSGVPVRSNRTTHSATGVTDVTDNPDYSNVPVDSKYRVTFKASSDFDTDQINSPLRLKNEQAGEYHLTRPYDINDVTTIEERQEDGSWKVIHQTPTTSSTLPSKQTTQQSPSTPLPASAPLGDTQSSQPVDDALKPFRTDILKYKGEGKTVTGTKTIYDATDRLKAIAEDTPGTSLGAQQVWFNTKRKLLAKNGDVEAAALFEQIVAHLKGQVNTAKAPTSPKTDQPAQAPAESKAREAYTNITLYRGKMKGSSDGHNQAGAIWTTPDKSLATDYASSEKDGEVVTYENITLKKPFVFDGANAIELSKYFTSGKNDPKLVEWLQDMGLSLISKEAKDALLADGYDSIVVKKELGMGGYDIAGPSIVLLNDPKEYIKTTPAKSPKEKDSPVDSLQDESNIIKLKDIPRKLMIEVETETGEMEEVNAYAEMKSKNDEIKKQEALIKSNSQKIKKYEALRGCLG